MSFRPYAAILLVASAASAVVAWNVLATLVIGASTAALLVGLRWRRVGPTLAAGWLLYLPMAVALARFFPAAWSYLAAGLFAVVVPERMAFEYDVSEALESPTGVDAEAKSSAVRLSKAHGRAVSIYASLALGVMVVSSLVAGLASYASVLITATVLLILAVLIYATR